MVYLNPQIKTIPGTDSFWTWINRVVPKSTFDKPVKLEEKDIILQYSTLGFCGLPGKSIACLWELYPQMKDLYGFGNIYNEILSKVYESARYSTYRTVASPVAKRSYQKYGSVEVIPLGVPTDYFIPLNNKEKLREKYGIPKNKKIGIFVGTLHHMKGFAKLLEYDAIHNDIHWILVFGRGTGIGYQAENTTTFSDVYQDVIVELYNCADFYYCVNRLGAFYMADWEAMSCNLPFLYDSECEPEFVVSDNPREDVYKHGWDRENVKKLWFDFFKRTEVEYK